jgi:hypothetical protein
LIEALPGKTLDRRGAPNRTGAAAMDVGAAARQSSPASSGPIYVTACTVCLARHISLSNIRI